VNLLAKWELDEEKLVVVITDNARNIVNATVLLYWQHFGCFTHTLQLGSKVGHGANSDLKGT